MTLKGAIRELEKIRDDEDFPFYLIPSINKVIETIAMEVEEKQEKKF